MELALACFLSSEGDKKKKLFQFSDCNRREVETCLGNLNAVIDKANVIVNNSPFPWSGPCFGSTDCLCTSYCLLKKNFKKMHLVSDCVT